MLTNVCLRLFLIFDHSTNTLEHALIFLELYGKGGTSQKP